MTLTALRSCCNFPRQMGSQGSTSTLHKGLSYTQPFEACHFNMTTSYPSHIFIRASYHTCPHAKGLFVPWNMKSSQGHVKVVISWTHSRTTLVYSKKFFSKWPWSLGFPKDIFWGLHYPLTWSNMYWVGRGKRGALEGKKKGKRLGPMAEKCCYIKKIKNSFLEKRRWKQEKTREWSNLDFIFYFIFQNYLFWTGIKKISTHSFFGVWSFLLVHIRFTPSEGPKDFINWLF